MQNSVHLLFIPHWLVKRLQPDVAKGNHRVGVVFSGWTLQDTFKLLLARPPFLLCQMQVADERPSIGMILQTRQDLFTQTITVEQNKFKKMLQTRKISYTIFPRCMNRYLTIGSETMQ